MDPNKNCTNCRFYQVDMANVAQGACRRYPPVPQLMPSNRGMQIVVMYPTVNATLSCGEHQTKLLCVDEPADPFSSALMANPLGN